MTISFFKKKGEKPISIQRIILLSIAVIFTLFETIAYYLIHIKQADPNYTLRYGCIIAATVFAWLTLIIKLTTKGDTKAKDILLNVRDGNFIRIAMIFTLIADYFLVAIPVPTEKDYLTGVIVFLGTQLSIFLHILANEKNESAKRLQIIIRMALMMVLVFVALLILKDDIDLLSIISVIYYSNLCVNAIFAHRIGRGGIMLTVGLILFALCDINVGLSALNDLYVGGFPEGSLLYNLMNTEADLIWIFYIPSQTLIPLTLMLCDKEK